MQDLEWELQQSRIRIANDFISRSVLEYTMRFNELDHDIETNDLPRLRDAIKQLCQKVGLLVKEKALTFEAYQALIEKWSLRPEDTQSTLGQLTTSGSRVLGVHNSISDFDALPPLQLVLYGLGDDVTEASETIRAVLQLPSDFNQTTTVEPPRNETTDFEVQVGSAPPHSPYHAEGVEDVQSTIDVHDDTRLSSYSLVLDEAPLQELESSYFHRDRTPSADRLLINRQDDSVRTIQSFQLSAEEFPIINKDYPDDIYIIRCPDPYCVGWQFEHNPFLLGQAINHYLRYHPGVLKNGYITRQIIWEVSAIKDSWTEKFYLEPSDSYNSQNQPKQPRLSSDVCVPGSPILGSIDHENNEVNDPCAGRAASSSDNSRHHTPFVCSTHDSEYIDDVFDDAYLDNRSRTMPKLNKNPVHVTIESAEHTAGWPTEDVSLDMESVWPNSSSSHSPHLHSSKRRKLASDQSNPPVTLKRKGLKKLGVESTSSTGINETRLSNPAESNIDLAEQAVHASRNYQDARSSLDMTSTDRFDPIARWFAREH
ncbi:hypothetical protein TruAng_002527 [Truncatella angustata]|nr:hypothetical protein TruAng_002527 [Truncatella angustata]